MKIEVWFDFGSQSCYEQIKEIDQMMRIFDHKDVELLYRSYPVIDHTLSLDAHRISHLAKKYKAQHAYIYRLFQFIYDDYKKIDLPLIIKAAEEEYLDIALVEDVLASDTYLEAVLSNLENARFKKIMQVPHIRIEGKIKFDGFTTKERILNALEMINVNLKANEHCQGEHCGRKKAQ